MTSELPHTSRSRLRYIGPLPTTPLCTSRPSARSGLLRRGPDVFVNREAAHTDCHHESEAGRLAERAQDEEEVIHESFRPGTQVHSARSATTGSTWVARR